MMAASSVTNLSIPCHYTFVQSYRSTSPPLRFSLQSLPYNRFELQKPPPFCSIFQITPKAFSKFGLIASSLSRQKIISYVLAKKISTLVLGSFVIMGYLRSRPAVAAPVSEVGTLSEKEEEYKEAQNEKIDDEELYEKLVIQNPSDADALKMVVNLKMKKGRPKEAVVYVEKLIELQPKEVEWKLLQALCYEMMGQIKKAKMLFKEILKHRPLLLRALHGLAMAMHKNLEGTAVFEMLDKALDLAKRKKRVNEERNIRILIAQMHVVKGEFETALQNFQALVDENPRDFRPYLCQGIVYSLMDKKEEAKEQFEIYQSLVPEEFPQKHFLDDVVLAAKTESGKQLEKEFKDEFS